MGIKELTFGRTVIDLPWLPDSASSYGDWSKGKHEHGTFIVDGERFAFLQIDARDEFSQYIIGSFPKAEEPENLKPSPDVQKRLRAYLTLRNRQQVFAYPSDMQVSFVYGTRYCKPCIVCSKKLETVDHFSDDIVDQPNGGTNFTSHGHYGSTVFDPMGREHLSINICDDCLKLKGGTGAVTHVVERHRAVDESIRTDWLGTH